MIHTKIASIFDSPWIKIELLFDGTYLIRCWQLFRDGSSKVSDVRLLYEDAAILASELNKHLQNNPADYQGIKDSDLLSEIQSRHSWREWNG